MTAETSSKPHDMRCKLIIPNRFRDILDQRLSAPYIFSQRMKSEVMLTIKAPDGLILELVSTMGTDPKIIFRSQTPRQQIETTSYRKNQDSYFVDNIITCARHELQVSYAECAEISLSEPNGWKILKQACPTAPMTELPEIKKKRQPTTKRKKRRKTKEYQPWEPDLSSKDTEIPAGLPKTTHRITIGMPSIDRRKICAYLSAPKNHRKPYAVHKLLVLQRGNTLLALEIQTLANQVRYAQLILKDSNGAVIAKSKEYRSLMIDMFIQNEIKPTEAYLVSFRTDDGIKPLILFQTPPEQDPSGRIARHNPWTITDYALPPESTKTYEPIDPKKPIAENPATRPLNTKLSRHKLLKQERDAMSRDYGLPVQSLAIELPKADYTRISEYYRRPKSQRPNEESVYRLLTLFNSEHTLYLEIVTDSKSSRRLHVRVEDVDGYTIDNATSIDTVLSDAMLLSKNCIYIIRLERASVDRPTIVFQDRPWVVKDYQLPPNEQPESADSTNPSPSLVKKPAAKPPQKQVQKPVPNTAIRKPSSQQTIMRPWLPNGYSQPGQKILVCVPRDDYAKITAYFREPKYDREYNVTHELFAFSNSEQILRLEIITDYGARRRARLRLEDLNGNLISDRTGPGSTMTNVIIPTASVIYAVQFKAADVAEPEITCYLNPNDKPWQLLDYQIPTDNSGQTIQQGKNPADRHIVRHATNLCLSGRDQVAITNLFDPNTQPDNIMIKFRLKAPNGRHLCLRYVKTEDGQIYTELLVTESNHNVSAITKFPARMTGIFEIQTKRTTYSLTVIASKTQTQTCMTGSDLWDIMN